MFLASFPAGPLQTNCYLVGQPGGECVIIDPGMTAAATVQQVTAEEDLLPVAVLCTHGHPDHVFAVRELTEHYGVPAYIHDEDRAMLSLRFADLGMAALEQYARQLSGGADGLTPPPEIRSLGDGDRLTLAGLDFICHHAPGHTPGCTLLEVPYTDTDTDTDAGVDRIVFTGDVLFAGSIGRTDLPGGDHATMLRTLREVVLALPDTAAVLPGHGGQTTIGRERAANPYLQETML